MIQRATRVDVLLVETLYVPKRIQGVLFFRRDQRAGFHGGFRLGGPVRYLFVAVFHTGIELGGDVGQPFVDGDVVREEESQVLVLLLRFEPIFAGVAKIRAVPHTLGKLALRLQGIGVRGIDGENLVGEEENVVVVGRRQKDILALRAVQFLAPGLDLR